MVHMTRIPLSPTQQLAKDVLTMAAAGGMPDSFWYTDQRIQRAVEALGTTTPAALRWAQWVTS